MENRKVDELRGLCRKRGLHVTGSKPELIKRLKTSEKDAAKKVFVKNGSNGSQSKCKCRTYLASGTHRHVYTGPYTAGPRTGQEAVKKVFKTGSVFEESFFAKDLETVEKAGKLIAKFNAEKLISKTIKLNKPEVWRTLGVPKESSPKCLVEPKITGEYVKFNSNTGYADDEFHTMQALSHYTYHASGGRHLVCDLQGGRYETCYVLTDPVVLSQKVGKFGPTDLGPDGIANFFQYHKCGKFCDPAWLTAKPKAAFTPVKGTTFFAP